MDLWEYYDRIEELIVDLRSYGHHAEAEVVETAIRGGATSGEVLSRLSIALREVSTSVGGFGEEVGVLAKWARRALRMPGSSTRADPSRSQNPM